MRRRWLAVLALTGCASSAITPAGRAPSSPRVSPLSASMTPGCARTLHGRSITLAADGVQRTALLAQPAHDGRRHPLIVAFHGYAESGADFDAYTRLKHVGSTLGAVVAEPLGLGDPMGWNVPDSAELGPSDVLMTHALITALMADACVDGARVVLAGISDGADMAVTAACAAPGTAAGLLLVAASTGPAPSCAPLAVLQVHGTNDPIDVYTGRGTDTRRGFGAVKAASAEGAFAEWSALAHCRAHTDTTAEDLRRLTGSGCSRPVQLIAVQGGGHTWPGAAPRPQYGATTTSIDTTALVRQILGAVSQ